MRYDLTHYFRRSKYAGIGMAQNPVFTTSVLIFMPNKELI